MIGHNQQISISDLTAHPINQLQGKLAAENLERILQGGTVRLDLDSVPYALGSMTDPPDSAIGQINPDPHPLTEERTFQHHFETTRPEPKKEKPRKAPTPKRTPEEQREARRLYERARNKQPERKEAARLHAKKIRKERKENGQCRHCSNEAITGQTRCESCRDRYNRSR